MQPGFGVHALLIFMFIHVPSACTEHLPLNHAQNHFAKSLVIPPNEYLNHRMHPTHLLMKNIPYNGKNRTNHKICDRDYKKRQNQYRVVERREGER